MQRAREELLADAGLAMHEHRRVRGGDGVEALERAADGGAVFGDVVVSAGAHLFAQVVALSLRGLFLARHFVERALTLLLRALSLGDVAHEDGENGDAGALHGPDRELDGDGASVSMSPRQLEPSCRRRSVEPDVQTIAVLGVDGHVDELAPHDLVTLPSEEALRLRRPLEDDAGGIEHHYAVERRL